MNVDKVLELFDSNLVCVNVGPRLMADALEKQNVEVLQVDWRPTAGGDKKMQQILADIGF